VLGNGMLVILLVGFAVVGLALILTILILQTSFDVLPANQSLSNSVRINFVPQCQLIFPCFMGHASVASESLILFHFSYSFIITRILWNEFKQFFIS
jgi:hypothetical protein